MSDVVGVVSWFLFNIDFQHNLLLADTIVTREL